MGNLWYLWNLWEIDRNCMGKSMVFSFCSKGHFLTGKSMVNPRDKWIQKWCMSYVISLVYHGRYKWSMVFSPGISTAAPKKLGSNLPMFNHVWQHWITATIWPGNIHKTPAPHLTLDVHQGQ
jgi:hypothetical protein